MAARRAGSASSARSALASTTGSRGGTSHPVARSTTVSVRPPTALATTGTPQAMASSGTMPNGSYHGTQTTTSADRIRTGMSARVTLPAPFGERLCIGFGEGDAGWLGGVAEGRLVRLYVCVAEPEAHERLLAANTAGTMRSLPADAFRSVNGPAGDEPVAHWVAALRRGRRLSVRIVECHGDFVSAARTTPVFADVLRTARPGAGCFGPEEVCTLADVDAPLRRAGIAVSARPAPR